MIVNTGLAQLNYNYLFGELMNSDTTAGNEWMNEVRWGSKLTGTPAIVSLDVMKKVTN